MQLRLRKMNFVPCFLIPWEKEHIHSLCNVFKRWHVLGVNFYEKGKKKTEKSEENACN